jgi:pyruvyl transferase EpsO
VPILQPIELIEKLKEKIHSCLDEFITNEPFALVDFPNIRNVGDSAIWLGELAYFSNRHKTQPAYISTMHNLSEQDLDAHVPSGPIFIHAGGNFGDIWVGHQDFRERILKRWPDRPVIQLPQSIHFASQARTDQAARIIDEHKNFTLLVRDEASLNFAQKHFDCRVLLCPDMALYIGPLQWQRSEPRLPVLAMLRGDRESTGLHDTSTLQDVPVEDWISEPWLPIRIAKARGRIRALPSLDAMNMRLSQYNAAAHQRLNRGIQQIGRARAIVTDRLHVHILSLLLGRPHAVLDNSYRKINNFMSAFTGETSLAYCADSLADALEWAHAQSRPSNKA